MSPNSGDRPYEKTREVHDDSVEEIEGSLKRNTEENKLMHTVLPNDKRSIDDGKIIAGMINLGVSFTPDLAFENMVRSYASAEKLYGKTLLRRISGYDPNFLKKNLPLPEFRRELKAAIEKNFEELRKKGLIDRQGQVTEDGLKLGALTMYIEELDSLKAKGYGDKAYKRKEDYGEVHDFRHMRKGDTYRDISVRKSLKMSARRMHPGLEPSDLRAADKKSKGRINIIYAFDTSGSMKGKKIEMAKKAGIALMHMALSNRDRVGLVLFGRDISESIPPSDDFLFLLERIAKARAANETNITKAIEKSCVLFPETKATKHLIVLTDALPTSGDTPVEDTIEAATTAANLDITISVVGIDLDAKGLDLAKKIAEIGKGRLYVVKDAEEIDSLVLQDYYDI